MKIYKKLSFLKQDISSNNQNNREKWLQETLKQIRPGSRVLDAGAGTQQYKKFCPHLDYISQDFTKYDGEGDRKGLQMGSFDYGKIDIISDIASIPLPDASLDAIMCIEVLEHLPEPSMAIREFSRLLKPRGHLILTAPFCSLTHFSPYHYSTGFNRYWYEYHLTANNLEIKTLTPNGNYFEYLLQELHRVNDFSKKYTKEKLTFIESTALFLTKKMLYRLSMADKNSSDSLCFGYHIHAEKSQKFSS